MLFKIIKPVFVVFIFFVFTSCSSDETTIVKPLEATQFLDQSYGADTKQNYDIYLPEGRTIETPVLVLVHGGFWSAGDKADMNLLVAIAKNTSPNYAIVNTNYRLASANANKHPTQLNDLSLLIEELKEKKEQYKIASNYYFVGVSAGAHLSLLYTYQKDTNHNIKAVCSIVGPTDFLDPLYLNSPNTQLQNVATNFLGYTYQNNPNLYKEASPITHVDVNDAPTLLFYGGKDQLIPTTQATRLRDALNEKNVAVEYNLFPDAGHDLAGANVGEIATKIKLFFDKY